ncbi:unnamed protein product [Didymodactylos carnosus]|uniref:Uncharacterized protein n=1 Tax=Didymodactylos carnosus TaxID=1234261 RepID=A0A8S2PCJ0_9BILA|nr:unnamed protein product [Didymodactylos carnosus]CAF4047785.1 unnamed protein product [Didymodactylos carnosus]
MASNARGNPYAKQYSTSSQSILDLEQQYLVIFTQDNSFSIVKEKQFTRTDHGLIHVHSGGKVYTGFIFQTGTLKELEKVAKTMSKPLNFEIDSDYEPNDISCTDHHTQQKRKQNQHSNVFQGFITFETEPSVPSPSLKRRLERTKTTTLIESTTKKSPRQPEAITIPKLQGIPLLDNILNVANTSLHSDDDDDDNGNNNFLYREERRTLGDHQQRIDKHSSYLTNSLPFPSTSASNDNGQDGLLLLQQLSSEIKKMAATQTKSLSSILKLEKMMCGLSNNQVKIQKAFSKKKIYIPLEVISQGKDDKEYESKTDFKSKIILEVSDQTQIDLLHIPATLEKANLYVTGLVDLIFDRQELVDMRTEDVPKSLGYKTIEDCVRSKFKLDKETFYSLWPELHEKILAKRRHIKSALKKVKETEKQESSSLKSLENEQFDTLETNITS